MRIILKIISIAIFLFGTICGIALLIMGGAIILWTADAGSASPWNMSALLPIFGLIALLSVSFILGSYIWKKSNKL
jgi:hypothetical protein